jgi:hypothetical protein
MDFLVRFAAMSALSAATVAAIPAAADHDGYGTQTTYELEVSHDGYVREGQDGEVADPTTYVVIEAESGTTQQVDGETVIVVQEPEPTAATEAAPPPSPTVVVEQPLILCPEGIWVDAYWAYSDGDYVWVEGHCVVERVNYVFVHPRWDYYSSVWWFVPGYYRPYGVYVGFGYFRPWHWYPPYHHSYYRTRHPVPVHRSVPRRSTTVRTTSVPRRGVVSRPGYTDGRTTTVERRSPTTYSRTTTVDRAGSSPTRTGTVTRTPTRTRVVHRAPTTRTAGVSRTRPSASQVDTVSRARSNRAVVSQPRANPTRTGSVRRAPSSPGPSRTSTVRRPSSGRPSVGRPRPSPSRGNSFGRPSFGASRPSVGRPGGSSRPSSGGFGGSRSVPTARGR